MEYYSSCAHCGNGLRYNEPYTVCAACEIEFCEVCKADRHAKEHEIAFYTVTSCKTTPEASYEPKKCIMCATLAHGHIACDETGCEFDLCHPCFHSTLREGKVHDHKRLTCVELPHQSGLKKVALGCKACKTGEGFAHCSRCFVAVKKNSPVYECRDCYRIYDACTASLCKNCYDTALHEINPEHHHFVSITRTVTSTETDDYEALRCKVCSTTWTRWEPQTLGRHAHSDFDLIYGSLKAEEKLSTAWRDCPRRDKQMLPVQTAYHSNIGCRFCWKRFVENESTRYCITCGWMCCDECATTRRAHHTHALITLQLRQRELPTEFWRELADRDGNTDWTCDCCNDPFHSSLSTYLNCSECRNYGFCNDCITDLKITADALKHSCTGNRKTPSFLYMDIDDSQRVGTATDWMEEQLSLFHQEKERRANVAEQQARRLSQAAPAAGVVSPRSITRKPVNSFHSAPAPPALPIRPAARAPAVTVSQPQPEQKQRRKSSGLGNLLTAVGVGVVKGLVIANNISGGGGGGGTQFASGGGVSPLDLQSQNMAFQQGLQNDMWSSVNSAASWSVQ